MDLQNLDFGNFGYNSDSGYGDDFVSENFDSCFARDNQAHVNCSVNYCTEHFAVHFAVVALDTASHHHKYWNQLTL